MTESLPPDVDAFVKQAVASGEYATEDAVLSAAVRLFRDLTERHAALRADIQVAADELDRGEGQPWDSEEIKAELDRQLDASQHCT